jgi:asparagine synthase (glutamine-hydrolysing)
MTPVRRMISSEQINPQALGEHIALRYPLGEHTIIKQIFKLKPGSYAEYWLDRDKFQITSYNQNSTKAFDLQSQLSRQFSQRAQYKNSGLFLSSGVDSSLLASFSKDSDFEGFTMSMDDGSEANEALAAARYSKHLGLPHHTVHCHFDSVDEVEQAVSESVEILEEPLGDSVALLQSQLFKAMGAMTKVALSGEAADEIFMGYSHHRAALMYSCLPKLVFGSVPNQLLGAVVSTLNPYPVAIDQSDLKRLARGLAGGFSQLVQELCTVVDLQKIKKICPQAETETVEHYFQSIRNLHDLRAKELENWLPNYNFARIDKLSLNAGLEVRLPYADRKLILSEAVTGRVSVLKKQKWTLHHLARQRISRPYWPVAKRPFTILKSSSYATHIEAFCKRELQQKDTSHYFEPAQLSSILETENSMFYWKALYNLTSLKLWLRSLV